MAASRRFSNPRIRALPGLLVVAVSVLVAVTLAGLSLAQGSPTGAQSAAQDQYGKKKITICHHTKSKKHPWVTIRIASTAWKAHKRHGDLMGPCSTALKHKKHGKKPR
jgi:hypothetical protein